MKRIKKAVPMTSKTSATLIKLAINTLKCNQKELAARLGVSQAQVSQWKAGEDMSYSMREKIGEILGIGDIHPEVLAWTGSIENANKWSQLIIRMGESIAEDEETGYDTYPLANEEGLLPYMTMLTLTEMGVEIPQSFPKEFEPDASGDLSDDQWELLHTHPVTEIIGDVFDALNDVWGFYRAYMEDMIFDDDLKLQDTGACNIESGLMLLAATKIEVDESVAKNFRRFKYKTEKEYVGWLNEAKLGAFKGGAPLRAELLDLVFKSSGELGVAAERESLGFNAGNLHPDVYMNELLVGMRVIHQVLPAIMKKLGMEGEFTLDESKLSQR
jgi:transcriptional regulator with XRE-family HTH domain